MNNTLEGKTALVTGASRGLGKATAEALAALGALVAINYANNDEAAQATLRTITDKGGKAFLVKKALGHFRAATELAEALDKELMERTGSTGLDILINNAGGGPVANLDATTPELYDKILGDNLGGPFFVTKALKPRLREGGRAIFVSSLGAKNALPEYVVYSISKSAIETFTVVMAKELGPRGITVNCIMPGLIASDANADLRADANLKKYLEDNTVLRRLGEPEDFAGVVLSLISPQMAYVTGQVIEVSGGLFL